MRRLYGKATSRSCRKADLLAVSERRAHAKDNYDRRPNHQHFEDRAHGTPPVITTLIAIWGCPYFLPSVPVHYWNRYRRETSGHQGDRPSRPRIRNCGFGAALARCCPYGPREKVDAHLRNPDVRVPFTRRLLVPLNDGSGPSAGGCACDRTGSHDDLND